MDEAGVTITHPLEFIICCTAYILVSIPDYTCHPFRRLAFTISWHESITQALDSGLALERGQACLKHELHCVHELIRIRPNSKEGLDSQMLEELIALGIPSAHEHDHLMVELERVGLEFHALAHGHNQLVAYSLQRNL
jgi:hypothetical protein